jgi:hypothetical protein
MCRSGTPAAKGFEIAAERQVGEEDAGLVTLPFGSGTTL